MVNIYFYFLPFKTQLEDRLGLKFEVEKTQNGVLILKNGHFPYPIYYYADPHTPKFYTTDTQAIHVDAESAHGQTNVILGRLLVRFGRGRKIHARHTVATRIDKKRALDFLTEHHLLYALPGKYRYGLYLHGELLGVAVFSGGRRMYGQHDDYRSFELLRFCTKTGVQVVGGFSKLLKAFERDFNPGDIMTYVDRNWSDGSKYARLGFEGRLLPSGKHSGSLKFVKTY